MARQTIPCRRPESPAELPTIMAQILTPEPVVASPLRQMDERSSAVRASVGAGVVERMVGRTRVGRRRDSRGSRRG
jgi:hypothetical protein